jgi:hypothetical protein
MSASYEQEQTQLREQIDTLTAEMETFECNRQNMDRFTNLVRKYTQITELTAQIINEFIERIEVHEGVWSDATKAQPRRGTRSQQIDVYLKYIGQFDIPETRTQEEIEAQRIAEEKLIRRRERNRLHARRKKEKNAAITQVETA